MGESLAAWFLTSHGVQIVGANVPVGRGELDIVGFDGSSLVAFEVRTISGDGDPIEAVDEGKRSRVRRLAAASGMSRVDLIGVRVDRQGFDVHWVPGAN